MTTMTCSHLPERKITIIGPRKEIDDLRTYLINETQRVEVIKSSPHFPFGDTTMDLRLLVCGREMDEVVQKIRRRLALSSIYMGWIDISQVFYPIHRPKQEDTEVLIKNIQEEKKTVLFSAWRDSRNSQTLKK